MPNTLLMIKRCTVTVEAQASKEQACQDNYNEQLCNLIVLRNRNLIKTEQLIVDDPCKMIYPPYLCAYMCVSVHFLCKPKI